MSFRVEVPGNLLLAGEYAVTEPGGLGIAMAVDRRVRVRAEPGPALGISGGWGRESLRWSAAEGGGSALFEAVVRSLPAARALPRLNVAVDSSELFGGGRKMGLGSSAAVAAGVAAALLRGEDETPPEIDVVFETSLRAHRAFQGGRGSGYDVAASVFGGVGLFTGGERPELEPVSLPWLGPAYLFPGERGVATSGAVQSYRRWKLEHPREASDYLRDSNALIAELLSADSLETARSSFLGLRDLGVRLGELIGVSASISPPAELAASDPRGIWKALGAGNELGLFLSSSVPAAVPDGATLLELAGSGLTWRE